MILKVKIKSIYDDAEVTEPDGTVRTIPPLHFGQMIWKDSNREYHYSRYVPKDFWNKAEYLKSKGWKTGYHYNEFYLGEYNERVGGLTVDKAMEEQKLYDNKQ